MNIFTHTYTPSGKVKINILTNKHPYLPSLIELLIIKIQQN